MIKKLPDKIFVTGTSTDVGKTVVSAILVSGLKCKYWKPIQSGLDDISDTNWIKKKTGLPDNHFVKEAYKLQKPISPHASAEFENKYIDLEKFEIPDFDGFSNIVIEGAGGIMVPINDDYLILDLIKKLNIDVLLVSQNYLGTINHTLLTIEQLKRNNINIIGIVMNGKFNKVNTNAIEKYGKMSIIAEIGYLDKINFNSLENCFNTCFGSN